jgi:translation initiation factor 2-alpha kinase 4
MPPINPWGKKPQPQQRDTSSAGYPELGTIKSRGAAPKSHYEEIQEDELIALASIYGDDFRLIETNNTAWKVSD